MKKGLQYVPRVSITDKLASYAAAKKEILPSVEHRQPKGVNNRAERSHQPTRQRERTMRRFRITWPRATLPLCFWSDLRSFSAQTTSSQCLGLLYPPAGALPGLEPDNRRKNSSLIKNHPPQSSPSSFPLIILFRKLFYSLTKLTIPSAQVTCQFDDEPNLDFLYSLAGEGYERNDVFLELVKVERLEGDAPPEGLWFTDLLKRGVLGQQARYGTEQVVVAKQEWLRAWGYGEDNPKKTVCPFHCRHPGLLTWPETISAGQGTGRFISEAQQRTNRVLIPVESLYAATTFGLLALELFTTTGMRVGELQQVNLLPDYLIRMVDDPPPGAVDQTPRIRYVLRLLPKGERTNKRHHYGIGKDGLRLIERTAQMLCAHYHLQPGEPLPRVSFDHERERRHRFEGEKVPYIFQYKHQHLSEKAISACLRFLMHGMVFQTHTGEPVILKPHLLRHAFATFAVQVEGLPLDLVAEWLKQKNLNTTRYYSQKGQQDVAEEHASFVERRATEINIREAIVRSPEEIRNLAEQARRRVGTLVPVCGGDCTFDCWCHNQFDCILCPSKAPDPDKRYQVEEKQWWAEERLAYYEREGLVLEAEKMRHLLRNCALELREMDMMVAYRKDGARVAQVTFYPRSQRKSQE